MKYQVVWESKKVIADDEFEKFAKKFTQKFADFGFKFLFARSLEGIRPEIYEPAQTAVKVKKGYEPKDLFDD